MSLLDKAIDMASKQLTKEDKKQVINSLPQTEADLIERRKRAESMLHNKSLMSSAAAVVPIPGLDVTADLKLMTDIIENINKEYGLSHKQVSGYTDDIKQKIVFSAAKSGSDFIGKKVTKGFVAVVFKMMLRREALKQSKWVPVIGQAVSGTISYYMMKKLGEKHIEKCERVARELMV
ncbi:DUF697 domain-containing protein [Macrococcus armenti]|uniref:DUF697 domain-containing protein n=1 Tax=Macrococcus armenti TaxID=2875764 RepID=A0ABY3ZY01_9STAP|nr:DUF697 domain-containing protein [Macrococcus armenti]UBH09386.1 DUF697 domain-containing protein [Macrococcus armenti]UBH11680.1 DUF697 domain-containing protein [Macrococcus armenti]UBH13892.1 DUF697 domain-containing protein [Macrococcus armenti]UBH16152.1 DUF697 domain-containing protein [Macrococcus armenti]UBH18512.1 DUF697 domain-containing protein [Macrococcus armenti]